MLVFRFKYMFQFIKDSPSQHHPDWLYPLESHSLHFAFFQNQVPTRDTFFINCVLKMLIFKLRMVLRSFHLPHLLGRKCPNRWDSFSPIFSYTFIVPVDFLWKVSGKLYRFVERLFQPYPDLFSRIFLVFILLAQIIC